MKIDPSTVFRSIREAVKSTGNLSEAAVEKGIESADGFVKEIKQRDQNRSEVSSEKMSRLTADGKGIAAEVKGIIDVSAEIVRSNLQKEIGPDTQPGVNAAQRTPKNIGQATVNAAVDATKWTIENVIDPAADYTVEATKFTAKEVVIPATNVTVDAAKWSKENVIDPAADYTADAAKFTAKEVVIPATNVAVGLAKSVVEIIIDPGDIEDPDKS